MKNVIWYFLLSTDVANEREQDMIKSNFLVFIICCFLLTFTAKSDNSSSKIDLYIGGFFGVNIKDGAWSSAALIPALEMALNHVNNDSSILTDYQLKYVWRDSKVNTEHELKCRVCFCRHKCLLFIK